MSTFYDNNKNHGNYVFGGGARGSGEGLENNAASALNRARLSNVYIYEYRSYGGAVLMIQNADWANLGALKNRNSSHKFYVA